MGWTEFFAALVVFFVLHAVPVRPGVKGPLVARFGRPAFSIGYSLLSLATLVWLIGAAGRAPYVELWPLTDGARHIALVMMALSVLILALGIARPNPLSFGGGGNFRFNPAHPGIVGYTRHPLLAAIALWALAHLVANGDLAHVILFGLFVGFSVLGMRMIDRRKQRELGDATWHHYAATRRELSIGGNGAVRLGLAVTLYLLLILLHGPIIGVWPVAF
ncbi:NnrU family protein [uncultured Maritimibacter sp.]|uniref:NnrU family protein n=1 Tax=uncultured Maritimibacter sp. TaxID=991866 RepID=UPI000AD0E404|nr:NnrU family protein [uncultured Maritimibacter sp.]